MPKPNWLGDIIYRTRQAQDLTQNEYGAKFNISGPAVFKFEKGFMRPSLPLWMRMADEAGIAERRAVLLWCKAKLPEELQEHIELQGPIEPRPKGQKQTDYARLKDRQSILAAAAGDAALPVGLREMILDDEVWALYKPSGAEINRLRDIFGPLGRGLNEAYRDALAVLRLFAGS